MNKDMVMAKLRRWQAELTEMIATLESEGKSGPLLKVLQKRKKDLVHFIEAIEDKSFIPKGEVAFEPQPVMNEIEDKVKKVKEGISKIKKLSKEKKRIIKELGEE